MLRTKRFRRTACISPWFRKTAEPSRVPSATNLTWTTDGLYVARGYTGIVARFSYARSASDDGPLFTKRDDPNAGGPGLVSAIVEDPQTHRIAVSRSADRTVVVLDDVAGATLATLKSSGQPFDVVFSSGDVVAADYNGDRIDIWKNGAGSPISVVTGPHPTCMLADGGRVYVADADGTTVSLVDVAGATVLRRYALAVAPDQPPGQTPSGMALSDDGATLFVYECAGCVRSRNTTPISRGSERRQRR